QEISARGERTAGTAFFTRFAYSYVHSGVTGPSAVPVPEPPDLRQPWKQVLHDAMANLADWRNPQILIVEERRGVWPNTEQVKIEVNFGHEPEERVVATLERYNTHRYAVSDFEPC